MTRDLSLQGDLNLIVTGYIEPNRPRISRQLAASLGMELVDVERRIEARFGETIANLRRQYGEQRLKAMETEALDDIALYRRALIRVSGYTLVNTDRLALFQRSGIVVCLVATLDSTLQRIHLALGARYRDPDERAMALGELEREWRIRSQPGVVTFDATYISEAELVNRVAAYWREVALRRG